MQVEGDFGGLNYYPLGKLPDLNNDLIVKIFQSSLRDFQ